MKYKFCVYLTFVFYEMVRVVKKCVGMSGVKSFVNVVIAILKLGGCKWSETVKGKGLKRPFVLVILE